MKKKLSALRRISPEYILRSEYSLLRKTFFEMLLMFTTKPCAVK